MTIVKSLAMIALLVGGTSLAIAQNGPPSAGGVGTARTGRHPWRSIRSAELQSPGGGADDEDLVTNAHGASSDQTSQKDVPVGKGHPPQASKNQFPHADDAQATNKAINSKQAQSLGPPAWGPRLFYFGLCDSIFKTHATPRSSP
jgi:hypothetical protein